MVFVETIILLIYKDFSSINFSIIGMLSSKTVVLDFGGFCHRKVEFIVQEFGICTEDYLDCASSLPPTRYSELTKQQKQSFRWLIRNLHVIDWDRGNYHYIYLKRTIQDVRLRTPGAIIYARGAEKHNFLSVLIEGSAIDLNLLECPSTSANFFLQFF